MSKIEPTEGAIIMEEQLDDKRIVHVPANRKETNAASATTPTPAPNPTLVQMTQIKRQQVFEEKLDEESSELEKMRPFNVAKQYIHRIVDVNLLVSNMSRLAGYATRGDVFTSTELRWLTAALSVSMVAQLVAGVCFCCDEQREETDAIATEQERRKRIMDKRRRRKLSRQGLDEEKLAAEKEEYEEWMRNEKRRKQHRFIGNIALFFIAISIFFNIGVAVFENALALNQPKETVNGTNVKH